jgi:hypothetical protein
MINLMQKKIKIRTFIMNNLVLIKILLNKHLYITQYSEENNLFTWILKHKLEE